MWPLLLVSIIALSVIIERISFVLKISARRNQQIERDFLSAVSSGDSAKALSIAKSTKDYVVKVLEKGVIEVAGSQALVHAATAQLKRFARGLTILDTAITISPLLGLLGTVTGMIHAFGLLGAAELSAPTVITGGIAEALIATAFGLSIAIFSLLPFNYLTAQTEEARHEIEQAARRLEMILEKKRSEG